MSNTVTRGIGRKMPRGRSNIGNNCINLVKVRQQMQPKYVFTASHHEDQYNIMAVKIIRRYKNKKHLSQTEYHSSNVRLSTHTANRTVLDLRIENDQSERQKITREVDTILSTSSQ